MNVFRFAIFRVETVIHAIVFAESLNYFRVDTAVYLQTKKLEKLGLGWSRFLGVPQEQASQIPPP